VSVTAADLQNAIVSSVGDTDSGFLAASIAAIWALYADKAQSGPRLQFLYAKREAIDWLLGQPEYANAVDVLTQGGLSVKQSQKVATLQAKREETQKEIVRLELSLRGTRTGAITTLDAVTPQAPPAGLPVPVSSVPDANDSRFRGDPYQPISTAERR
jgi:hypothetical protein